MATSESPGWFRLSVVSGVKTVIQKYVSGGSVETVGDVIAKNLLNTHALKTIAEIWCSKMDDRVLVPEGHSTVVDVNTLLFVLVDFGTKYIKVKLADPEAVLPAAQTLKSAIDVLMKMNRSYDQLPQKRQVLIVILSIFVQFCSISSP
jgi:hypothetical protein